MMQPTWSGPTARTFDPLLPPFESPDDLGARAQPYASAAGGAPAAGAGDGLAPPWYRPAPPATDPPSAGGWGCAWGQQSGGATGLISSLIGTIQQLLSALLGGQPGQSGQPGQLGGPGQRFSEVDLGSTGDPHLSAVGTRAGPGGGTPVDEHFDSMTDHRDLLDSADVAGGYRVSTAVTQPDAKGVTYNRSATVQTGGGRITLERDGSFSIADDGRAVALAKGQSVTLSGGETVGENQDGSLVVRASGMQGGSIATTLRATGSGVDVTAHAQDLEVGGDIVSHDGAPPWAARA